MVTENATFTPDGVYHLDCGDWREAQDVVYQVANLFFAVAFLVPDDVRFHVTLMRATLCLGCSCLVVSGGVAQCHVDVVVWYLVFLSVNVFHLVYALAECWPSAVLRPELRSLHAKVFAPLRVSRVELKELAELGSVKDLAPDEFYALQGETAIGERLSVLLSGRLKVRRGWIFLHSITSNQFVDSPEYLEFYAQAHDDHGFVAASIPFQVSISAVENSRILTWNVSSLNRYLSSHPFMRVVIDGILGRDVTRKLSQVHEQLLANPQYMCIVTDPSVSGGPSEPDEATALQQRRTVCRPNPTGSAAGGSGMRTEAWDVRPGSGGSDRTALRPRAIDLCPLADKTARRSSGLAKTSNGNFTSTAGKGNPSDSRTSTSSHQHQHHKVETPIGPYSPSQVSFETFV